MFADLLLSTRRLMLRPRLAPLAFAMVCLLAPATRAQDEAGGAPSSAGKPRPRLELARALDELAKVRSQLEAAQARIDAALVAAEAASTSAKAAEVEEVVRLADEARSEAAAMQTMFADRIDRLTSLVERGAKEAPASLLPENDALRSRILAAAKIADRAAADKKLLEIEREIAGEKATPEALADPRVGLLRYCIADNLREMASSNLNSSRPDTSKAETMLQRAIAKYKAVLTSKDMDDTVEGSSLHAAALRHVVEVASSLYAGYRDLARKDVRATTYGAKAKNYRDEAQAAFERLKADYPAATSGATQQTFVDLARADAQRLSQ